MQEERILPLDGATVNDLASLRETMIAQPPSAENPFRTRKNRLRRSNYMLRQAIILAKI